MFTFPRINYNSLGEKVIPGKKKVLKNFVCIIQSNIILTFKHTKEYDAGNNRNGIFKNAN